MKLIRLYETVYKPISVAFLLLYLICIAFSLIFFTADMTGFNLLYIYCRFAFFLSAISSVLAYLSGITSFRSHTDEVLSAQKYPGYYQNRTFLFILGYILFLIASILGILLIASNSNDSSDYFLAYFGKSFAYNLVLPIIISLGVAYMAARMGNKIGSAVLLVLFLLLTSPVITNVAWRTKPFIPVDQLFRAVLRPFRIYYENGIWSPNTQLGLQTDNSRGSILLFWVLFLASIICYSLLQKRVQKRVVSFSLVLISLCCLVYAYLPSGAYRIDSYNWDGTMQDYDTYYDQPIGVVYDTIDYAFTDYELNLSFGRFMEVDSKLQLHSDTPRTQFVFTLYHGYSIHSITSEDVEVSWTRDGDTVNLITEKPVTDCTLLLSYRGNHDIFFSYSEGTLLPGWFPWYPMAGNHQVFLNFETYPSGYNVYNRIQPAHITLRTNDKFTMVSNLEPTKNGSFEGTGDSITLIGGEIVLLSEGQVKNCVPLDLVQDKTEWATSLSQQWRHTCDTLALYGLESPAETDTDILVSSMELTRFYLGVNGVAFFDDYILTCDGQLNIENVSKVMMLRYNSESYLASILCSWGGLKETPQETCSYWLGFLQAGGATHPLEIALRETLEAADAAGKGGEAARKIAQFLCEEGATGNEQAFLEGLRDQYDSN